MSEIKLTDVKSIQVTFKADVVNSFLAEGWKLVTTASGQEADGSPVITYCLGWTQDSAPIYPA